MNNPTPENFGIIAAGQTVVTATATSTKYVNANPNRVYLFIQNTGANSATIKFDSAQSANEGIVLAANASITLSPAPINSVWAKSATGTTLNIVEGIK